MIGFAMFGMMDGAAVNDGLTCGMMNLILHTAFVRNVRLIFLTAESDYL